MLYPTLSEYKEAILLAEDNFNVLTYLRPVLDEDGQPVMTSGNFAVVFKMKDAQTGKLYAVKCFTREQEGREEAYRLIDDELKRVDSPYLTSICYLDKELFVDTSQSIEMEFPVLLMDWVEGKTLDKYLRENLDDKYALEMLAYRFSQLAQWLIPQPFAHGDLKPDNILVQDDGSLVLVDYDGMYVPAMKGQKARELGSPDFRHPQRTEDDFDEHIDDFALASILVSLKGIAMDSNMLNDYGAPDRLLFSKEDYLNISRCKLLKDHFPSEDKEWNNIISWWMIFLNDKTCYTLPIQILSVHKPSCTLVITNDEDIHWEVSDEDLTQAWVDKYGAKYSKDKKRLLLVPAELSQYTIRKGTKVICESAFADCEDLISVVIPDGVIKIGPEAFQNCSQLNHITIPSSMTSIGDRAFYNCYRIKSIAIPSSVINIGKEAFSGCHSLKSVSIPNSIKKIPEGLFYLCDTLKSIVIPNSVTAIDDEAFYTCIKLESIVIPSSVTSIGNGAFSGCAELKEISLPDSINNIGQKAFSECTSLEKVILPQKLKTIEKCVFAYCNIKGIILSETIKEIKEQAFICGGSFSELHIPPSVNLIKSQAFSDTYIGRLIIENPHIRIEDSAFDVLSYIKEIIVPKGSKHNFVNLRKTSQIIEM